MGEDQRVSERADCTCAREARPRKTNRREDGCERPTSEQRWAKFVGLMLRGLVMYLLIIPEGRKKLGVLFRASAKGYCCEQRRPSERGQVTPRPLPETYAGRFISGQPGNLVPTRHVTRKAKVKSRAILRPAGTARPLRDGDKGGIKGLFEKFISHETFQAPDAVQALPSYRPRYFLKISFRGK